MYWQTIRTLLYTLPWLAIGGFWYREVLLGPALVGIICLILYIAVVGRQWEHVFESWFGVRERDVFRSVLGWGFVVCLLGLGASAVVVFGQAVPGTMTGVAAVIALLTSGLYAIRFRVGREGSQKLHMRPGKEMAVFRLAPVWSLVFLVLFGSLLYIMQLVTKETAFESVWQIFTGNILYVGFAFFLVLFAFVFSKTKVSRILGLIVLASVVVHMYLPLSHVLPWGADTWRHMGVEEHLLTGEPLGPTLFGKNFSLKEVHGVYIPEVFLAQHKFNYGQLWGLVIFFVRLTGVSTVAASIWIGPILFSLLVPLLLFRIGALLFRSWRHALLGAALSLIPFSLQAVGALTLPISLGVINFLFLLFFWTRYMVEGKRNQAVFSVVFLFLLGLGYILPFVLGVVMIAASLLWRACTRERSSVVVNVALSGSLGILAALCIIYIPILELLSKFSSLPVAWNVLEIGKRMVGEWSGWFYASQIRPHHIASGNMLFNHTPLSVFIPNIFLVQRWHLMIFMVLVMLLSFRGWFQVIRIRLEAWIPLLVLSFVGFGGYAVSWYGLYGEHSFARRLDPFLAIFLIFFAIAGGMIMMRFRTNMIKQVSAGFLVVFLAWTAMSTYTSGPDMRVVSVETVQAAEDIAATNPTCVLADTWPLLPLEYASKGKVVGGGFPIDRLFGQTERVRLYNALPSASSTMSVYDEALRVTGAASCVLLLPHGYLSSSQEAEVTKQLGRSSQNSEWVWWLAETK
jgi:hypothetical protein